jgi:hypothetical protein
MRMPEAAQGHVDVLKSKGPVCMCRSRQGCNDMRSLYPHLCGPQKKARRAIHALLNMGYIFPPGWGVAQQHALRGGGRGEWDQLWAGR